MVPITKKFSINWQLETGNWRLQHGFTLIELLVVIAIIGILAAIGLNTFPAAQRQARDQQRRSDITQYQTALETYANANRGFYPSRNNTVSARTTLCTDLGTAIISGCPEDPRSGTDSNFVYNYQSDGSGGGGGTAIKFVLWARLEGPATTTYWVICSNGKSGNATVGIPPSGGSCPI